MVTITIRWSLQPSLLSEELAIWTSSPASFEEAAVLYQTCQHEAAYVNMLLALQWTAGEERKLVRKWRRGQLDPWGIPVPPFAVFT
ncbi:unnamed protein product [Nippostrongylus brasiliensis]|uniref:Tetratricopeptide repeat protein 27 n=1 Tax=Nippostrongylus brasiliensis TaxID=27835 RepID=A0A0N4YAU0_NIPBR|nr:unnamed protein product [Nippostrongylus brasiliensis]